MSGVIVSKHNKSIEVSVRYRTTLTCDKIKCMNDVKIPEYVYYNQNTMYFIGKEKILTLKVVSDGKITCINKRKNELLFSGTALLVTIDVIRDGLLSIPTGINIRACDVEDIPNFKEFKVEYIDNLIVSDDTDKVLAGTY